MKSNNNNENLYGAAHDAIHGVIVHRDTQSQRSHRYVSAQFMATM